MSLDKEILDEFRNESNTLLKELESVVEDLETPQKEFPKAPLEEFALKIDRIMGASKTLLETGTEHKGLSIMSQLSEICKFVGYKAVEVQNPRLIPIFAAFWADTLEVMEDILQNLEDEDKIKSLTEKFTPVLQKRLGWLKDKLTQAPEASKSETSSQGDIDALMADFGI